MRARLRRFPSPRFAAIGLAGSGLASGLAGGLAASAIALLLSTSLAKAAMDPVAVAEALGSAYATAAQGGTATYESATLRGNDVVIRNMLVTGAVASYELPEIVVSDPAPRGAKAGFTTAQISTINVKTKIATTFAVTMTAAVTLIEDVTVLPPGETDPLLGALRYRKGTSTGIDISEASVGHIASATRTTYERTDLASGERYVLTTEGVTIPIAVFGEDEAFAAFGYSGDLHVAFKADVTFDPAAGTLALEPMSIAIADVGTLSLTARLAGLSSEKIMDPALAMQERMMALYTSGTLVATSVRFDNLGIVERVLDKQAKAAGIARPTFANSMARALPLLLTPAIPDVAFRAEFANAAGKFLQEPKSIVLTGEPAKPLPLASLVLSIENLPSVLRLKARAEQ